MIGFLERPRLALGTLCLGLTALFAYELMAPPAEIAEPVLQWRTVDASLPLAMASPFPAVEAFASVDARFLFNPARKPVEVLQNKPSVQATPPPPTDLALMGTIIGGDKRVALVRTGTSSVAQSVIVGGQLSGWQVMAIEPDHISLHAGTTDYTVNLFASHPAGTAPPSRVTPSTPPPQSTLPNLSDVGASRP